MTFELVEKMASFQKLPIKATAFLDIHMKSCLILNILIDMLLQFLGSFC